MGTGQSIFKESSFLYRADKKYKKGVCPIERFLDPPPPPPINFVHDQISIYLALFRVMLG